MTSRTPIPAAAAMTIPVDEESVDQYVSTLTRASGGKSPIVVPVPSPSSLVSPFAGSFDDSGMAVSLGGVCSGVVVVIGSSVVVVEDSLLVVVLRVEDVVDSSVDEETREVRLVLDAVSEILVEIGSSDDVSTKSVLSVVVVNSSSSSRGLRMTVVAVRIVAVLVMSGVDSVSSAGWATGLSNSTSSSATSASTGWAGRALTGGSSSESLFLRASLSPMDNSIGSDILTPRCNRIGTERESACSRSRRF